MASYLIYIGKSALASGAFYLIYLLLFQHQKQFTFNRIYLPVSLLLSFVIPLITFTTIRHIEPVEITTGNGFAYLPEATGTTQAQVIYKWYHYLFALYIFGIAGFLFFLLLGQLKAVKLIRFSRLKRIFNEEVNITPKDIHPFSFFNKIVLSEKTLDNPNLEMIVNHEKVHVKEKHTIDILFSEILFLFQWFNPFAWLIRDAMRNNLEYLTDHQIAQIHNPESYQLAMVGLADKKGIAPFLTALNGSQLKNRIIMMKKKNENKYALLKQLVILPLVAVLVMGLSNKEVRTEIVQPANNISESISDIKKEDKTSGKLFDSSFRLKNSSGEFVKPTYIIDGKEEDDWNHLKPTEVNSLSFLADDIAVKYYGDKGIDGVVQVSTIDWEFPKESNPLIIVNNEVFDGAIRDIPKDKISQVYELRYPSEFQRYGGIGKDGVILIYTNNMQPVDPNSNIKNLFPEHSYLFTDRTESNLFEKKEDKFKVKGKVTNEKDEPISAASIIIEGTTSGTITDNSGNYEIRVANQDAVLVFSMIGYEFKKVHAKKESLDVILKKSNIESKQSPIGAAIKYAHKVSGKVCNKKGEPIPGASVLIKGKAIGTICNQNGEYIIELKDKNETLIFSMVGYEKQEIQVKGKTEINVELSSDNTAKKDEIVVDGYGHNSSSQFPISNKLSGSNEPLYVVDGEIVESLDNLNPEDLESISVLKDEKAIAAFGEKARNGLIIVTTKNNTKEIIFSEIDLRKFVAKRVRYPQNAREAGISGTVSVLARVNKYGELSFDKNINPEKRIGEIVVVAYAPEEKVKPVNAEEAFKTLEKEAERVIKMIHSIHIEDVKNKTIAFPVKFELQEKQ